MPGEADVVKERIDIVALISESVPLKRAGSNFKARCPFHEEDTPSFVVSPSRQMFHCFGCLPPGQLVQTARGWHPIEVCQVGDLVISRRGVPRSVLWKHEHQYVGDLIDIETRKLGGIITLTADHEVFVVRGSPSKAQYKVASRQMRRYPHTEVGTRRLHQYFPLIKVPAGEIRRGDLLLYPINRATRDVVELDLALFLERRRRVFGPRPREIPSRVPVSEHLLRLIGYWVAEGSTHRAYTRFSLGPGESDLAQEIVMLMRGVFGLESSIHTRHGSKSGIEVNCCHALLQSAFGALCGTSADTKHFPFVFRDLPLVKQRVLLEAYMRGDGTRQKSKQSASIWRSAGTVSPVLSEQLVDLVLRAGFFPSLYVSRAHQSSDGVRHRQSYHVGWVEDSRPRYGLIYPHGGVDYWLLPIRRLSRRLYRGPVHNLTVAEDHSFLARHIVVANCGKSGDGFTWLMEREGMTFPEALRVLAQRAGVPLTFERPERRDERERLRGTVDLAATFYQRILLETADGAAARDYLVGRGLTLDSIKAWRLGFCPELTTNIAPKARERGITGDDLARVGVLRETGDRAFEFFYGRILFPLSDVHGSVVGLAGRVFGDARPDPPSHSAKAPRDVPKYINSPETALYTKSRVLYGLDRAKTAIRKENVAILVEGYTDVIASHQAGIANVVATAGTALTEDHLHLLRRFTDRLAFSFDADAAGAAATRRALDLALAQGFLVSVVALPSEKDPADLAVKDPEAWRQAIAAREDVFPFLLRRAQSLHVSDTPEGQRAIAADLLPLISQVRDRVVAGGYVQRLAAALRIDPRFVYDDLRRVGYGASGGRHGTNAKHQAPDHNAQAPIVDPQIRREERLLVLLLAEPSLIARVSEFLPADTLAAPHARALYAALQNWYPRRHARPDASPRADASSSAAPEPPLADAGFPSVGTLRSQLAADLQARLDALLLAVETEWEQGNWRPTAEAETLVRELLRSRFRQELQARTRHLREADGEEKQRALAGVVTATAALARVEQVTLS